MFFLGGFWGFFGWVFFYCQPWEQEACARCGKRFNTKRALSVHQLLHEEPTLACPHCPKRLHTSLYLKGEQFRFLGSVLWIRNILSRSSLDFVSWMQIRFLTLIFVPKSPQHCLYKSSVFLGSDGSRFNWVFESGIRIGLIRTRKDCPGINYYIIDKLMKTHIVWLCETKYIQKNTSRVYIEKHCLVFWINVLVLVTKPLSFLLSSLSGYFWANGKVETLFTVMFESRLDITVWRIRIRGPVPFWPLDPGWVK